MTADLTGWSTLALALVTTLLAGAAFAQIVQSQRGEKRRFEFELFRLAQSQAPIIVGDVKYDGTVFDLRFRNVGNGAAINMRFSGLVNGQEFSAAQHGIPAIGAAAERVAMGRQSGQGLAQLLIRYEDVFGNVYATEYQRLTSDSAWYVWRRPHLGRGFFPRPSFCSEDYPEWVSKAGFTSMLARGYGSMTSLMSVFLTLEALETAALQDVAAVVLQTAQNGARQFNAGNLILIGDQYIKDESAGGEPVERRTRARLVVGEAIGYLLSQNVFAISGEIGAGSGLELQVTRLSRTIKTREDFSSYGKASLVPPELLHPKLVAVVRPLFLSGQYDAAVLTAFKQIEIAVREIGPYPRDEPGKPLIGTDLMREAFRSDGPLAGTLAVESEKKALGHLFAGAIGYFKNPQSHREVGIDDANVAASRILFASELLMLVDYHQRLAAASTASPVIP